MVRTVQFRDSKEFSLLPLVWVESMLMRMRMENPGKKLASIDETSLMGAGGWQKARPMP